VLDQAAGCQDVEDGVGSVALAGMVADNLSVAAAFVRESENVFVDREAEFGG
jgi:hypothetical protein